MTRIGAIVLAGGRSRRFGTDKLAVEVGGRALVDHPVEAVGRVADAVVVVFAPSGDRSVPGGVIVAHDAEPYEGPLAGAAAGLAALPVDVDRTLIVGGDMPSLVPEVLQALIDALDGAESATLEGGGPLPMSARRGSAERHAHDLLAAGERRLRALPSALGATTVPASTWRALDPHAATLRDIDAPGDLS
jgi:molybdopterin-guanine dinucleotide biosynthesis protein A